MKHSCAFQGQRGQADPQRGLILLRTVQVATGVLQEMMIQIQIGI